MIAMPTPGATPLERATAAALEAIVSARFWGGVGYVDLPIYHPSGSAATVQVQANGREYVISDHGFAFREAEMIGAERMFRRIAADEAAAIGARSDHRTISMVADEAGLPGAMVEVATASAKVSAAIAKRAGVRGEAEIVDHLFQRLVAVFGDFRVKAQVPLVGPSTKQWYADAVVELDGRAAVFQAVTRHHASVYSTSAMFHDIALGDGAPATIAVVRDKHELGPFLGILAQAGSVIEEAQPDAVYRHATEILGLQ